MRWKSFTGVSALIGILFLLGLSFFRIRIPFGLSPFLFWLIFPLLAMVLAPLNRKLRLWRRSRGRDIEEEEQFEIEDTDFISLRRQSHAVTAEQRYKNFFKVTGAPGRVTRNDGK